MSQCTWRMPGAHHLAPDSAPLWCIREEGHEGPHKNYTGRWDSEVEFRTTLATELPATERPR